MFGHFRACDICSLASFTVVDGTVPALLDFEAVSEYIIPKAELCGRVVEL